MARYVEVAAAQMGPDTQGTNREDVVDRMASARTRWGFFGPRHPEPYGLGTQPVRKDA